MELHDEISHHLPTGRATRPSSRASLSTFSLSTGSAIAVPSLLTDHSDNATRRYIEFFTAQIRNKGTRAAYGHAVNQFFNWCDAANLRFDQIEPIVIATYIESLTERLAAPTVKVHLAAIKVLYDYLVTGHIVEFNPAASVKGPRHVVKKGKTPVLDAEEARKLIDAIDISTIAGLRDRALIGVMVFSFARISAVLGMNVEDCFQQGRRMWFRLHEKGGKYHEVPAHHNAEQYLDEYIQAAGLTADRKSPLFRTIGPDKKLSARRMHRIDALRMVKRRALDVGLPADTCNHTWRATGITAYLQNGGSLEHAMQIACHESARTTKLYDRTSNDVSLDEIERIRI